MSNQLVIEVDNGLVVKTDRHTHWVNLWDTSRSGNKIIISQHQIDELVIALIKSQMFLKGKLS